MKKIPLFPLNIVVFPGEDLNLHVFEPRYKQLIRDCIKHDLTFGIPSYVLNKIELGTEVEIAEIVKEYPDGRMDISTKAKRVFLVKQYWNPWEEKMYAGGEVEVLPDRTTNVEIDLLIKMKELANQLFAWLQDINAPDIASSKSVFDIGHKIGFKLEEEYELLRMTNENDRLKYTISHLEKLLPALERAQFAQERIKQNGHFKHLDPLKF